MERCSCQSTKQNTSEPLVEYVRRSWDLGQFERFRRLARDKPYDVLLQHIEHRVTSSLQVSVCSSSAANNVHQPSVSDIDLWQDLDAECAPYA
jgi:hypothetical protein